MIRGFHIVLVKQQAVLSSLLIHISFLGKLIFHPENGNRVGRCRKEEWEAFRKVVWTMLNMSSSFFKYIDVFTKEF